MSDNAVETVATAVQDPVEAVTDALMSTYIDHKVVASGEDVAHAASAAEGRRLYIGNLAYSTTEDQLKEFFAGFSIESTSIPTNPRTGRTVGYAFVDLTTKDEAERAIAELSGREVLERKVSVQFARKPGTSLGFAVKKDAVNGAGDDQAQQQQQQDRPRKGRGGYRGRGRGRFRVYFKRNPNRENGHAGGASDGEVGENEEGAPTNVPSQVLAESTNALATGGASSEQTRAAAPAAAEGKTNYRNNAGGYRPKKRGPPENGVPSTIKVMVANLPYELSEDKLKELFAAYQPESAKIALRPIPRYMVRKLEARGEPRKGRGFGFVTLANEEMQRKAVEEMNGKTVDGREIAVKVAIDPPKVEEVEQQQEGEKKTEIAGETKVECIPVSNPEPEQASV